VTDPRRPTRAAALAESAHDGGTGSPRRFARRSADSPRSRPPDQHWINAEVRRKDVAAGIAQPHAAPPRQVRIQLNHHSVPARSGRSPDKKKKTRARDTTRTAAFGATASKELSGAELRGPVEYVKAI